MSDKAQLRKEHLTTKWIPVKSISVVWGQSQRELDPAGERRAQRIADSLNPASYRLKGNE